MKRLSDLIRRKGKNRDSGDAVLVTVLISIPLLCVCFAFATGISLATWQKTSYLSSAQAAATASLQSVQNDGYLGLPTMTKFVDEYLSQTGRSNALLQGEDTTSTAGGQGTGAGETGVFESDSCSTAMINGVERQLPYIELQLDINRAAGESNISTYPYWNEGTTAALQSPVGGHGTIVAGQQYRVINAKVWEASKNVTWFGVSADTPRDMECQPYNVDVSAILFGANEDLAAGETCFQPDMFPVEPGLVQQVIANNTIMHESPLTTCDAIVSNLRAKEVVTVTGTYRTWSYITRADGGIQGWVPTNKLQDLETWNITYDLDGGTAVSPLPTSYNWRDSTENIPIPAATKPNYNFGGWLPYSCSDPTSTKPVTNQIVFGSYGNLCFKAVFSIQRFNISWDPNGGSGAVATSNVPYGSTVTVPANRTRAGYTANGWWTQPTGGTRVTGSVTVTTHATYYQQWTANVNTISVDQDGGTGGGASPSSYSIRTTAQTVALTPPTRGGYTFANWSLVSGTGVTLNGNTINIPAGTYVNIAVKANWTANRYNITIGQNGGSGGSSNPTSYLTSLNVVNVPLTPPTRTGYTFNGWSVTTNTSGATSTINGNTLRIPGNAYGNVTVSANWTAAQYTITFNCNGRGTCPASMTYTYGQSVNIPNATGGGTFDGWNTSASSRSNLQKGTNVLGTTSTGNKTLYAHWSWSNSYNQNYGASLSWNAYCSGSCYAYANWSWSCPSGGWFAGGGIRFYDTYANAWGSGWSGAQSGNMYVGLTNTSSRVGVDGGTWGTCTRTVTDYYSN